MGNPSEPPERLATFERERRHLLAVAFRILGSDADAEDVVQEAWIRFSRSETSNVRNMSAWLTTIITRLCLDALRRRREHALAPEDELAELPGSTEDPEEVALLASDLTAAFTVVLEDLTPPQRVALILHDAFGTPFDEVATVLGTTTASAKKLASRARRRVRQRTTVPAIDVNEARRVVEAFLVAAQRGDTAGLIALLDPDVVRTADPQVLPSGGLQRVRGAEAVAGEARLFQANARRARVVSIDGGPGLAVIAGSTLQAAMLFEIADGRIRHYDVVADPDRLRVLHIEA